MTMMGEERPQVDKVLSGLKDFQQDTVNYVFRRLYEDEDSTSHFLIADEVGLGKTLVARGIIAKVVDHLWEKKDHRIDVIYICSNQEIARQNIDRLNISDDREFNHASRATLLPITIDRLRGRKLNFVSLTPGTSFNLHSSTGWAWERAVLYNMLQEAWNVSDGELINVLRGDVGKKRWKDTLDWFAASQNIDRELQEQFILELNQAPELKQQYDIVAELIGSRRKHLTSEMRAQRNRLIGKLRHLLASSSLSALEPDLVILDEFQRFKYLLEDDNEFALLARKLFTFPDAKVLLLSATPYKMYTLQGEQDENHYADFIRTTKFLLDQRTDDIEILQQSIDNYRNAMFHIGIYPGSLHQLRTSKKLIENILRKVMVRTERLAVSSDRNGMLTETCQAQNQVSSRDLISFVNLDRISRELKVDDQVEYWKSSSYQLNLMEGYKLKRKFNSVVQDKPELLFEQLVKSQTTQLDWKDFQEYQQIDPGNARMRSLLEDTVETGNWKFLWLPPSLPYYKSNKTFFESNDSGDTKTLIFSAWRIVPKVISILVSYEVERRMIGDNKSEIQYSDLTTNKTQLLRFAQSQGRLTGMYVFTMTYPCLTLAFEIDPLDVALTFSENLTPLFYIKMKIQLTVKKLLNEALENYKWETTSQVVDERWYWAALLILDSYHHPKIISDWLNTENKEISWSNMLKVDEDDEKESRFSDHVIELRKFFEDPNSLQLGKQPEDLVDVLTAITIGSPTVTVLRSLLRVTDTKIETTSLVAAAAHVGFGFRTLFNQPDAITMVQSLYPDGSYWQKVINYCVDGNLQAVLDEYSHILLESLGLKGHNDLDEVVIKIGKTIRQALSIRAPSLFFDEIILDGTTKTINLEKRGVRCRYALRFGDEKGDSFLGGSRDTDVRIAFNSPFRPFVLATTSVGQEGLDFHQYCHRVVHWNLPSNPVDLEQREGRVHRYKGHVIRRNLASNYQLAAVLKTTNNKMIDPWDQFFNLAISQRSPNANDLVPFWVFDQGKYSIERLVPMLPLSSEIGRLKKLKKSLVIYRSVIGQPRQEELLQFLEEQLSADEIKDFLSETIIDLSPKIEK